MASNLANVYSNLMRKFGELYTITHTNAPSYLRAIVGDNENPSKIVLVHLEDRNAGNSTDFLSPSKLQIKKNAGGLDLTGSPLKDDCLVEGIADLTLDFKIACQNPWILEEEYHKGLSLEKARTIISSSDFQLYSNTAEARGSVWFLCSAQDFQKTLLLQYEFIANGFSRGIVNYKGIIHPCEIYTQTLLKNHFSVISKVASIETHIENTYRIKNNVTICCSWTTASTCPTLIDLSTCDVVLSQTFCIGDCGPLTEHFIKHLRMLMTIRDDILAYKKLEKSDTAKEPVYRCGLDIEISEIYESIKKAILEITDIIPTPCGDNNIENVIQNARERRLNDLTDKLWEILKCCSSYKDLKQAFNKLFQCAVRCNIVNTPTNKNRLAEIITEVAKRRLAIPILTGSEPLELLLEIGLEKLYKDYEYIFVESKIYRANDFKNISIHHEQRENEAFVLNVRKSLHSGAIHTENAGVRKTFLQPEGKMAKGEISDPLCFQNSNFDEMETAQTLAKLFQIHCTLEHLLMIHINLNLPSAYHEVCNQLLNKPARTIHNLNDSVCDQVEITLLPHYIREHLKGKDPYWRRISIKSHTKYRQVKSVFYYNMENICPPNILESFKVEEQEYTKKSMYHCWLYRKIVS